MLLFYLSAKNKFSYILNDILKVLEKTRLPCDFESSIKNEMPQKTRTHFHFDFAKISRKQNDLVRFSGCADLVDFLIVPA